MSDVVKLNLRLPTNLHDNLKKEAKRNGVSLNTQIINQCGGSPASKELEKAIYRNSVKAICNCYEAWRLAVLENLNKKQEESKAKLQRAGGL